MPANTDTFSTSIAYAVRAELSRQGKKPSELNAVVGLSRPTVTGRLNGLTPFTANEIDKIATFLGITAYDLIDSAALGRRFSENNPVPHEAARITPPRETWAQPSRSKRRSA